MLANSNPTLTSDLTDLHDARNRMILADGFLSEDVTWPLFFQVKQSLSKTMQYGSIKPVDLYSDKTEGDTYTYSKITDGPNITHTAQEKQFAIEISSMEWAYMLAEAWSKIVSEFGAAAARLIDSDCMSVFPDGFTVNGADGVPLWSASHTWGSNYATTTFGYAPLRTLYAAGRRRTNDDGNLQSVMYDRLLLPPDKVLEAQRIINSDLGNSVAGSSGTFEQANELKGRFSVYSTPEFTSTTQWFAIDSRRWDAEIAFRQMPNPQFRRARERGNNAVVEDDMIYHYGHNNSARAGYGFAATS